MGSPDSSVGSGARSASNTGCTFATSSAEPPTMSAYPFARPHTPPETPQSRAPGRPGPVDRLPPLRDAVARAAPHERGAVRQAPHPAGDATVEVADAPLGQH